MDQTIKLKKMIEKNRKRFELEIDKTREDKRVISHVFVSAHLIESMIDEFSEHFSLLVHLFHLGST